MSILGQLQQEIADRISADPLFAEVSVLWEKKKDIINEVERSISQIGAGVLVVTPLADVTTTNLPGPYFDSIFVQVQVMTNPVLWHTADHPDRPRSLDLAERICVILHHWTPASLSCPMVCAKPTISLAEMDDGLDGYDVRFTAQGGQSASVEQLATPEISEAGGEISIAHPTPGAALYYTTDGRNPAPRTGTLYTAPFTPASGSKVRARAWLAGYLTSEATSLVVP